MFRRMSAAKFADLSVTSHDDFEVAELEEHGCEQLQKAISDMEDGFFQGLEEENSSREQQARSKRTAAKDAQGARGQHKPTAREEACLGSRTFQRVPSDRQTYRPLDEQCSEWGALQPNLRVRGFSAVAQQRSGSREEQRGVQELQVQPHKRGLDAWTSDLGPRKTSWPGPSLSVREASVPEGNGSCSETGTSGTTGHGLGPPGPSAYPRGGSPAQQCHYAELIVLGQPLSLLEQQGPGTSAKPGPGDEEVLASDGALSEVLALQYDAMEAHVRRAQAPLAHPMHSMAPSRRPSHIEEPAVSGDASRHAPSAASRQRRVSEASGLRGMQGMAAVMAKRDEKALRVGLPAVEPALALLQQATDQAFDCLWQQLVPVLLPLVQHRLAARLVQRQEAARQEAERRLRAQRLAEEREERKKQRGLEVEFQGLGDGAELQEQEQEVEEGSAEHVANISSGNSEDADLTTQPFASPFGVGSKALGVKGRPPPGGRNALRTTGRIGLGQGFLAPLGYIQTESPPRPSVGSPFVNGPAPAAPPQLLTVAYGPSYLNGGDRDPLPMAVSEPQGIAIPPPPPPPPPPTGRFWQSANSGAMWTLRKRSSSSLQPLHSAWHGQGQGQGAPPAAAARISGQHSAPAQSGTMHSSQRCWPPSAPQPQFSQATVQVTTLNGKAPLFSSPPPPPPPPPPPHRHVVRSPPQPPTPPPPPRPTGSTYPPGGPFSPGPHAAAPYAPAHSTQAPAAHVPSAETGHVPAAWFGPGQGQDKGWRQESDAQQQWQQRQQQHQQHQQQQQQLHRRGPDAHPRPPLPQGGQWGPAPPPPPGYQRAPGHTFNDQLPDTFMGSGMPKHQKQLTRQMQQQTPMLPRLQAQMSQSPR